MGIEDLDVDSKEYADRVLLIGDDPARIAELEKILVRRDYIVSVKKNFIEGSDFAAENVVDLVIMAISDPGLDPLSVGLKLSREASLKSASHIILSKDQKALNQALSSHEYSSTIQFLFYDVKGSELLLKCATLLRLRKLRAETGKFNVDLASKNSQLRDLTQRFKSELAEARQIQQSLMPSSLPKDNRCSFAAAYVPLEAVGGDIYDIWRIDDDNFGFMIGDVTGHGLSAAFIGAMSKMALSHASKQSADLMLSQMNDSLAEHIPEGRFITVIGGRLNASTGQIQIARGGHPPAVIWRASTGLVEESGGDGMPLGIIKGTSFANFETVLEPGDRVFLMTDGLTETFDLDGKMMGMAGVSKRAAQMSSDSSLSDCLKDLLDYQKEFSAGRILKDDTTLVAITLLST